MGGKLTVLENRTYNRIEMRMWVHPARPDHFEKIIRIKPGGSIRVKAKEFHNDDDRNHPERLEYEKVLVLVYVNGVWTGNYILPLHLMTYATITCDRDRNGQVLLRGKRANFNSCRLKCFGFFPAKYVGLGKVEEDI